MIKAIIFDCFGVLRPDPLLAAYEYFGGDIVKDAKLIHDTTYASNSGRIPSSGAVFSKKLEITEDEWRQALEAVGGFDQPVLDYALQLKQNYKIALLSNVSKGGLQRWFTPEMLDKYFDLAVASGDIGFAKPEAQAFEYVADNLGVRLDECVMIDDREEYLVGAQGIGMEIVHYKNLSLLKQELEQILHI